MSAEVQPSLRIFDRKLVFDDLTAAVQEPGIPKRLSCSPEDWPIDIIFGTREEKVNSQTAAPQSGVLNRSLLVLGATLGGWAPPVPQSAMSHWVVLMVRGTKHYGCRACRFISGHPETWTGPTDPEPCVVFWKLVCELVSYGLCSTVSFIGISAGVDTVLSLVSSINDDSRTRGGEIQVRQVVLIAGVYHPEVFPKAWKILRRDGAGILVHHHEKDRLCPWPPAERFWEACRRECPTQLYVNVLRLVSHPLLDRKYHDVAKFLLARRSFWDALQWSPPDDNYHRLWSELALGRFTGERLYSGYDVMLEGKAHCMSLAFCALSAARRARVLSADPISWCANIAKGARAHLRPAVSKGAAALLDYFPEHLGLRQTWHRDVPFLLANSILDAVRCNPRSSTSSVFKAGWMDGLRIVHRVEWVVGPLALLRITFPEEANKGSKWADARWSHFLRVEPRHGSFQNSHLWPVSPAELQRDECDRAQRRHRAYFWPHHETTPAWQATPMGFEDHRGFEPNDFVTMRLCDGNGTP